MLSGKILIAKIGRIGASKIEPFPVADKLEVKVRLGFLPT